MESSSFLYGTYLLFSVTGAPIAVAAVGGLLAKAVMTTDKKKGDK